MKHLQLTPPLLLITMGYPGSGKSFFARQFADQYGIARVSEDRIRYELFEKPQYNADEADIIDRITKYMVEEIMQTEQTIICDAASLTAKTRKSYIDLAQQHGYRTLVVWLQTDIDTSKMRALKRDKRSTDSKHSFELDTVTFERLKDSLQRPSEKELSVVISGKHAFRSQSLTVLKKITSIYSDHIAASARPTQQIQRPVRKFIQ